MKIQKASAAGTLESSDIYIEISPSQKGIEIDLQSVVLNQFGDEIKSTMMDVLRQMQVENAHIRANDRGALECVIRARLETALLRAEGREKE